MLVLHILEVIIFTSLLAVAPILYTKFNLNRHYWVIIVFFVGIAVISRLVLTANWAVPFAIALPIILFTNLKRQKK
ncbi:hypothetical protein [Paenibacillus hexagrammi]|uniref:Uncharacterized protein n=1 Tax=Paenibacillus hexagrammi TaxID=2908839 RepID=A0ABY3SJ53_9BACL|nr:hypothetical protein [Paenibacillus sp. YPD9-1]UJF33523.1 hypothetical protein L0M14_29170 [Paenibacillus sp. YPD9-1]